jgi:hypothetical protein
MTGHALVIVEVPVVNLGYEEHHIENRCKECGFVYGWVKGRRATAEEMEAARAGKIQLKTIDKARIARVG